MRYYHLFLMLSSLSSLLLFWIPDFSTISLSLNCIGEGCSGDRCYGDHCTGNGCSGPTCGASQGNGGSGETRSDTGSDTGESLAKSSGFKDGDLEGSIGQLAGETRIDCMSNCTACQDEFFATCQEITNGLNYDNFDYRGKIPLSLLDSQL